MNLKPCPFCGSEQIEESEDDLTVWMQCQHCDARSGGFLFKDRHLVSDEWNTRTPEEKSEEVPVCPNCGARNFEGDRLCRECRNYRFDPPVKIKESE